jgi:hypothetical protein
VVDGGQAPLVFTAPEEGRYGFTVVVKGGSGMSGERPRAGQPPQHWVEVDVTPPTVKLFQLDLGVDDKAVKVTLRWSATDKNLTPRPITLSYAERPEGPWHSIAEKLENTGRYVWEAAPEVPLRAYLRIQVTDRAGNVATAATTAPILLDASRPRGFIRGVEPVPDKAP